MANPFAVGGMLEKLPASAASCARMLKDMPQDVKDSIQEVVDLLWPDSEDAPPSYRLKNQATKKLTR